MLFMCYYSVTLFRDQIYFKYMAWVRCISVANHNWSYEPHGMRTVRLKNKETAKRN